MLNYDVNHSGISVFTITFIDTNHTDKCYNTGHVGEQLEYSVQRIDDWRAASETTHRWALLWSTEDQGLGGSRVATV